MIINANGFLDAAVRNLAGSSALVIAYALPDSLGRFDGRVTYYGAQPPQVSGAPRLESVVDPDDRVLTAALSVDAAARTRGPYGLVYIDHHHALKHMTAHVNAALRWADEDTLFVLPGAAPPHRGMTGLKPELPWWLGEVWLLPEHLEPDGRKFMALTTSLPPFGLLVARNFKPLNLEALEAASARSRTTRPDTRSMRETSRHTPLREILQALAWPPEPRDLPRREGMTPVLMEETAPEVVRSDYISSEETWLRPSPAFVLDLSGETLDVSVFHQTLRPKHGSQVDHISGVHLLGRDAMLSAVSVRGARRFLCRYTRAPAVLGSLGTSAAWNDADDVSTAMQRDGDAFHFPQKLLDQSVVLDHPVFFATPEEPLNWGLWLLQIIPAVHQFRTYRSDYPQFLCDLSQRWQAPFLRELGLAEDAVLPHRQERVHFSRRLATLRHTSRTMHLSEADRLLYDDIAERLSTAAHGPAHQKIYVSRRGLDHHRVLLNEGELTEALEARGFTTVSPERMSFRDQVKLFRNARAVVGLGGAGMFNVVFCRPGTRVVTVESGMTWVDTHCNIFGSRGVDYGVILGRQDPTDPILHHKRWSLDVPHAVAAIDAFVG